MTKLENRQYKNSMFVDLFFEDESAEENDIALYNALHDEPLPEGTKIQRIRVEDVLYMNFKNDISFGAGGKVMIFGEHQASINENMPLRSLLYIGRAYERLIPVRDRYKKKIVPLPKPEFYTFYNGEAHWTKEKVLRLSDAYKVQDGDIMLDLKVTVININPSENHEILEKCRILREYGQFVDLVRKYQRQDTEEPYRRAIEDCIQNGILADYLKKKGSEVVNMLIAEYDYDMDIEVQREEAYLEGLKAGREAGEQTGRKLGETNKLLEQVRKKLEKGKTFEEIADALEEPVERIKEVAATLEENGC